MLMLLWSFLEHAATMALQIEDRALARRAEQPLLMGLQDAQPGLFKDLGKPRFGFVVVEPAVIGEIQLAHQAGYGWRFLGLLRVCEAFLDGDLKIVDRAELGRTAASVLGLATFGLGHQAALLALE